LPSQWLSRDAARLNFTAVLNVHSLTRQPCSAKDDEQVAAALGYTVHLLLLASKYLEVSVPGMCILVSVSLVRTTATLSRDVCTECCAVGSVCGQA
jgi:hypothetical protein